MFDLGLSFGLFRSFSICLSITLFQASSSRVLFNYFRDNNENASTAIVIVWAIPYAIASIPFFVFFHMDRKKFLVDNGLWGSDYKP